MSQNVIYKCQIRLFAAIQSVQKTSLHFKRVPITWLTFYLTFNFYSIPPYFILHAFLYLYAQIEENIKVKSFWQSHCLYCFVSSYTWDLFDELSLNQLSILIIGNFDMEERLTENSIMDLFEHNILGVVFTWDSGRSKTFNFLKSVGYVHTFV